MAKIRTTITIDELLYEELILMAHKGERNVSQQISYMIKQAKVKKEG